MSEPAGSGPRHPPPVDDTADDDVAAVLGKADALLGRYRRPPVAPDEDFPLLTEVLDDTSPEAIPPAVTAPPESFPPAEPRADDVHVAMQAFAYTVDGHSTGSPADAIQEAPAGLASGIGDGTAPMPEPQGEPGQHSAVDEPSAAAAATAAAEQNVALWDGAQHEQIASGVARHLSAALTEALTRVAQERAEALAAELRLEAQALARRAVAEAVARALAETDPPLTPPMPEPRDRRG